MIRLTLSLFVLLCYTCLGQNPGGGGGQMASNSYELPHKRFEYKYSFKGPYLAQKDGTVPFWEYQGNAIASEEMVRITPSLRSKQGSIWTKSRTVFDWWEVELLFRVNGRGRLGADGLAFWFTEAKGAEGPVFGSNDNWRGLGVFFDSFDNDGKGNNPYIMAMLNDGTKSYDHQTDGSNQQMSGCLRDFRNKPFPVRAKIEYYRNTLTIMFHSGNSNNDDEYELCLRNENVFLPQYGYFGVSAATGGLADDHDAIKFLTHSLHVPGVNNPMTGGPAGIADPEKEKFTLEYEKYKEKLEKQKEDYFKSHPDEAKKFHEMEGTSPDNEYESLGERELQQIFTGQSHMFEVMKSLNHKLDEILGRQERTLSLMSSVQMGGGVQQGGGGGGGGPIPIQIQRHEVESLLGQQQELVRNTREIKTSVLQAQQQQQGSNQQQPASMQQSNQLSQQLLTETRDGINVLRKELGTLGAKLASMSSANSLNQQQPYANCPQTNCVSSFSFFAFMSIHLIILLGYSLYRSNKESQAKKFY